MKLIRYFGFPIIATVRDGHNWLVVMMVGDDSYYDETFGLN